MVWLMLLVDCRCTVGYLVFLEVSLLWRVVALSSWVASLRLCTYEC